MLTHPEMGSYVPDRSDNCQADRDFANARGVIRIDCDVEGLHLATVFSEVGGLSEDGEIHFECILQKSAT